MKDRPHVQIIETPFAYADVPSLALGWLKAVLQKQGVRCQCHYLNLMVLEALGRKDTNHLSGEPCIGNYIFAQWLFPECKEWLSDRLEEKLEHIRPEIKLNERIPQMAGCIRQVVDNWLAQLTMEDCLLVGFSVSGAQLLASLYLAKEIKCRWPHAKIVFGGSLCGIEEVGTSFLRCFPQIDIVVFGEGEETLVELVDVCSGMRKLNTVRGIAFHDQRDQIVKTAKRPQIDNLDLLPVPDHSDYMKQLNTPLGTGLNQITGFAWRRALIPIQMSRGCSWNRCAFCENPGSWGHIRSRSPQSVVEEISRINEQYHVFTFYFVDQELTGVGEKLFELCDLLAKANRDLGFFAHVRAPKLTKQLVKAMKRAGFVSILPGIEAFSNSLLRKLRKGTTVMDNVAALKYAAEAGIRMQYNLISHFPGEEESDVRSNLELLHRVRHFDQWKRISRFVLQHGSYVKHHPDKYSITVTEPSSSWKDCFPKHLQEQQVFAAFRFKPLREVMNDQLWDEISKEVSNDRRWFLFYLDTGSELLLIDTRNGDLRQAILDTEERRLVHFCTERHTLTEILQSFSDCDIPNVTQRLDDLTKEGLLFRENNEYISLILPGDANMLQRLVTYHSLL